MLDRNQYVGQLTVNIFGDHVYMSWSMVDGGQLAQTLSPTLIYSDKEMPSIAEAIAYMRKELNYQLDYRAKHPEL